jgi:hypothetical protein
MTEDNVLYIDFGDCKSARPCLRCDKCIEYLIDDAIKLYEEEFKGSTRYERYVFLKLMFYAEFPDRKEFIDSYLGHKNYSGKLFDKIRDMLNIKREEK